MLHESAWVLLKSLWGAFKILYKFAWYSIAIVNAFWPEYKTQFLNTPSFHSQWSFANDIYFLWRLFSLNFGSTNCLYRLGIKYLAWLLGKNTYCCFYFPKNIRKKSNKTSQNTWNINYGILSHLSQGVYKWKVFHFAIHQWCLVEWLFWPQLCFRIKDIIQVVNTVAVALHPWERIWEFL